MLAGRMTAGAFVGRSSPNVLEESPGSTETGCRVTPGEGSRRRIPPREGVPGRTSGKAPQKADRRAGRFVGVSSSARGGAGVSGPARVKGCGKSAPRPWRQGWHGKPHPEQDRIGTARLAARPGRACFRPAVRVGRARRMATCVPDEWSSPTPRRGADRTRLTGRPACRAPRAVSRVGFFMCSVAGGSDSPSFVSVQPVLPASPLHLPQWCARGGKGKRGASCIDARAIPARSPVQPPCPSCRVVGRGCGPFFVS